MDEPQELELDLGRLPGKKERFALELASGKSGPDAARAAGYKEGAGLYVTVSRLLKDAKVMLRVQQLRAPIVERAGVTLETHLNRLAELGKRAEGKGQLSAAIRAEVARGQAAGLYQGAMRFEDLEALPDDELEKVAAGKTPATLRLMKGA